MDIALNKNKRLEVKRMLIVKKGCPIAINLDMATDFYKHNQSTSVEPFTIKFYLNFTDNDGCVAYNSIKFIDEESCDKAFDKIIIDYALGKRVCDLTELE